MKNKPTQDTEQKNRSFLRLELFLLTKFAIALFILIALINYSPQDMSWNVSSDNLGYINNTEGLFGAWLADFFYSILGLAAYVVPIAMTYNMLYDCLNYKNNDLKKASWAKRIFQKVLFLWFLIIVASFISLYAPIGFDLPAGPGGMVGQTLSWFLLAHLSNTGTLILLMTAVLIGIRYYVRISFLVASEKLGLAIICAIQWCCAALKKMIASLMSLGKTSPQPHATTHPPAEPLTDQPEYPEHQEPSIEFPVSTTHPTTTPAAKSTASSPSLPMSLLHQNPSVENTKQNQTHLESTSRLLETKLMDFSIQAQVIAAYPGPVVTLYELELAPGIKVSKVSQCSKDIARSLSVNSVRVREVMPGKPTIGIEIPNQNKEMVYLSDILADSTYQKADSPLTVALGKDIAGIPTIADLASMPHLLIAGTTGSGKSVCVNTMLISLLYKASPEELRLILIDPKMLELAIYKDIPHLLTPVVTQMSDAAGALLWCVNEMDRRYALMAELGVRHCDSYNEKIREAEAQGNPIPLPPAFATKAQPNFEPIPKILVLADEFADLMMVSSKKSRAIYCSHCTKSKGIRHPFNFSHPATFRGCDYRFDQSKYPSTYFLSSIFTY